MPAEFESGFFREKPAWHKLGNVIPAEEADRMSLQQLTERAGLDWPVVQKPVFWLDDDGVYHPINAHVANIRRTDRQFLGIPTTDYKLIQNEDILRQADGFVKAGSLRWESAGSLQDGKLIWGMAEVPGASFTLGTQDENKLYALLASGHKPGVAFQVKFTSVRVVCANTLSMALNEDGPSGFDRKLKGVFRMVHRSELDQSKIQAIHAFIQSGVSMFNRYADSARRMASVHFDRSVAEACIIELLQPELLRKAVDEGKISKPTQVRDGLTLGASVLDQIVQREQRLYDPDDFSRPVKRVLELVDSSPGANLAPGSAWNTFNAVTRYVDYDRGRTADSRLNAAWFGTGDTLKSDALNHVLSYAQAVQPVSQPIAA